MNENGLGASGPFEYAESAPGEGEEFYLMRREPWGKTMISGPYPTQQEAESGMTGGASGGEFVVRRITPVARSPDPGSYCYGRRLLERKGWEVYLGDDEYGEHWERISDVKIQGDDVLLTVEDGTTYRARYDQAVRCRKPPAPLTRISADGASTSATVAPMARNTRGRQTAMFEAASLAGANA